MITPNECKLIVIECVRHLLKIVGPDGEYIYSHKLNAIHDTLPGYNILRHCGTTWFVCKAISDLGLDLTATELHCLEKTITFITQRLVVPGWNEGMFSRLCLPERGFAKLGANGLALLMLHEYSNLRQRRIEHFAAMGGLDLLIARLQNYILSQASNGDFIHKRHVVSGAIAPFRSNYYTGEALFGLLRGRRLTPEVSEIFQMLMKTGYGIEMQSHWMCYAACEALESRKINPALLRDYITQLVGAIVKQSRYRDRRQSTEIACRTEALTRFLLLHGNGKLTAFAFEADLVKSARRAAADNLLMQLEWYSNGQFHKGDGDFSVQIDYIQHNAMSALQWSMIAE
jgi:hypothetical protein